MLAVVQSAALFGIDGLSVRVELDLAAGLPGFATVGLPENSVREARVRVHSAVVNSDYPFPNGRITVNLAPAHVRKEGTGFDLPIAVGVLVAQEIIPAEKVAGHAFLGELSLSGEIKPVRGVLAQAQAAFEAGAKCIFVAKENGAEAALVKGLVVRTAHNFRELTLFLLTNEAEFAPVSVTSVRSKGSEEELDLEDVRGQFQARRALEIAAAGSHNLLFIGGPGSGKTMMAKRLPGILPQLSYPEALEVTRIHSAAGLTMGDGLITTRPFRAPHHSMTRAGLVGGGAGIPRPGELTLASHGVLFLDEMPEFPRHVLEVLRQPLESGEIILSRANANLRYPAKIMLVAAMNPCPCGHYGSTRKRCRCSSIDVSRYRARLSGPLLDRIDLHVDVPPVDVIKLSDEKPGESSGLVRARVIAARQSQRARLGELVTNASMSKSQLQKTVTLEPDAKKLLHMAVDRMNLSARAYDRVLRVSRTIADLSAKADVQAAHISEAIRYRGEESLLLAA